MEKHTEGLLEYRGGSALCDGTGTEVAQASMITTFGQLRENAERLAAAWNAADGIPTEHLTPGGVKRLTLAVAALDVILFPGDLSGDEQRGHMRGQLVDNLAEAMEEHGWAGDADENKGFIEQATVHPARVRALIDVVSSAADAIGNLRVNDFADDNSFAVVGSSLQNLREALALFKPPQTKPSPITPDDLADILLLIEEDYPLDVIAGWTQEQREEAAEWAGAVHLKASDNPVKVPPKPAFLTR